MKKLSTLLEKLEEVCIEEGYRSISVTLKVDPANPMPYTFNKRHRLRLPSKHWFPLHAPPDFLSRLSTLAKKNKIRPGLDDFGVFSELLHKYGETRLPDDGDTKVYRDHRNLLAHWLKIPVADLDKYQTF